MKQTFWGYWLIVLGIFIIVVLLLVQSFTSSNTQDYYLVKSITEASMIDAVDYGYYNTYGEIKINKEKFYESFLRRFAEEASLTTTYTVEFSEVYEAPPKVSVAISSKSDKFSVAGDSESFDIKTKIDSILESTSFEEETSTTETERTPISVDEYKEYMIDISTDLSDFSSKTCTYTSPDGTEHAKITIDYCGYVKDEATLKEWEGFNLRSTKTENSIEFKYCVCHLDDDKSNVYIATTEQLLTEDCK